MQTESINPSISPYVDDTRTILALSVPFELQVFLAVDSRITMHTNVSCVGETVTVLCMPTSAQRGTAWCHNRNYNPGRRGLTFLVITRREEIYTDQSLP